MRRPFVSLCLILLLAVPVAAQVAPLRVTSLFPATPHGFVTDSAGLLSPAMRATLTDSIRALQSSTRAEIAVVTLPSIGDASRDEVAVAIGRAYGVGQPGSVGDPRRRVGFVVLLVPKTAEHKGVLHIATASGTEGFFLDRDAGNLTRANADLWRAKRYDEATFRIVVGVIAKTRAGLAPRPAAAASTVTPERSEDSVSPEIIVLAILCVVAGLILVAFRSNRQFLGSVGESAVWADEPRVRPGRVSSTAVPANASRFTVAPADPTDTRWKPDVSRAVDASTFDPPSAPGSFGGDGAGFGGGGGGTDV